MALQLTPSQTVGPYFSIGLTWEDGAFVVPEGTPGAIRITGTVYDGEGEPIPDAMLESWQADGEGRYNHPDDPRGADASGFRGFARAPTSPQGTFTIHTVKPGPVPGRDGATQAPHVELSVFARGLLNRVVTRIYFADETEANAADPILQSVPEERRGTLLAEPAGDGAYRFDVHLQGEGETVFFAI
jgi:protocatechuate 3,4-dioxygenase alpha subunit